MEREMTEREILVRNRLQAAAAALAEAREYARLAREYKQRGDYATAWECLRIAGNCRVAARIFRREARILAWGVGQNKKM